MIRSHHSASKSFAYCAYLHVKKKPWRHRVKIDLIPDEATQRETYQMPVIKPKNFE